MTKVKVDVVFYTGRRKTPPKGNVYRPHFVVKDTSEYLGIQFENLIENPFGTHILCDVKLLYDGVDYSQLTPDTSFLILEGALIVGEGIVIS